MRRSLSYFLSPLAILLWWLVAFRGPVANEPIAFTGNIEKENYKALNGESLYEFESLFSFDRSTLMEALRGDTPLMVKLIQDWDLDSEILVSQGLTNVKRLDRETFLRSQLIGRLLLEGNENAIQKISDRERQRLVIDDIGQPVNLDTLPETLLPQTFMSAEILLALVDLQRIVALPGGYRSFTTLYPDQTLNEVPLDIDRHHSERLLCCIPDLAFVSGAYSHPGAIHILQGQGVPLYHFGEVHSLDDIKRSIVNIGQVANEPLKAELMAIFIDAAMNAIDNKREVFDSSLKEKKITVAYYHTLFSLPGSKTLTEKFIERMGFTNGYSSDHEGLKGDGWSIPIREEQIHIFNPDHLVIITTDHSNALEFFYSLPALQDTAAAKSGAITVVDEQFQKSITQSVVIAYYDLTNALVKFE